MFKVSQLAGFGAGVVGTPVLDKLLLESGDFLLLEDGTSRLNLDTGATDPYFSKVVMLASFNGSDGATTFIDESLAAHGAFTFNDDAQLDTAQAKFGTASLLCDGTDDYISLLDHDDWTMPGEMTIDCWFRLNSVSNDDMIILAHYNASGNRRAWALSSRASSGEMWFIVSADGAAVSIAKLTGLTFFIDTWYFVRSTRDSGNVLRVALNGIVGGTTPTLSGMHDSNTTLTVGANGQPTSYFNGWVGECRITAGVARTITDFPDNPFPRA